MSTDLPLLVGFLAAHAEFFAGLTAGAVLSPLVILAGVRALSLMEDSRPAPPVNPPADTHHGDRRRYRGHYDAPRSTPGLSPQQQARVRARNANKAP